MRNFKILVIGILLSACAPQVLSSTPIAIQPTLTSSPLLFEEPTIPNAASSATSTPSESTELDFQLPPDCSVFDPAIHAGYYADLSHGACNHPALSPDEAQIAYAALKITESGEIIQEARLFSRSLTQSLPIYSSRCGVLRPEWALTGDLVISDSGQDVGCGYTVIYDVTKGEIIASFDGAVSRNGAWSSDRNSLFTVSPQLFGPECSETLSGFDFVSKQLIPVVKPITPNTNLYVVIGKPLWSTDNKSVLAVLRDGVCSNLENNECTYSNSYVISVTFDETAPAVTYPYYDSAIDYSFAEMNDGNLEIHSAPSKMVNCQDVEREESQ
jgi:hypothetical protein